MSLLWLQWVRRLQAIAQTGLSYTENVYDRERYDQLSAIAAEIAAQCANLSAEEMGALFTKETGPSTPKIDVRGAVVREGKILLVRERAEGAWTLPGGWVDVEESASEAVEREVREESGFLVRATKLVAALDRNRHGHPPSLWHTYKLIFQCELTGGAAATSYETDAVDFFDPDALPPLSLTRITAAQIQRVVEHIRNPAMPTDFD